MRLFGVDFSGDAKQWKARCARPNVWVAAAILSNQAVSIDSVVPVADLPGNGNPFDNLSSLLSTTENAFAAIDAPFSVPAELCSDAEDLWARVSQLPKDDRSFPKGATLVEMLLPALAPRGKKLYRQTEKNWIERGVNTRSTVWAGPRGGAPFAAACMTLLSQHTGAVWPLRKAANGGCTLVEAFPAAQLKHWGLPHSGYNGPAEIARHSREEIVAWLVKNRNLQIEPEHYQLCIHSADALDSIVCVYAAAAIALDQVAATLAERSTVEGLICVHP